MHLKHDKTGRDGGVSVRAERRIGSRKVGSLLLTELGTTHVCGGCTPKEPGHLEAKQRQNKVGAETRDGGDVPVEL